MRSPSGEKALWTVLWAVAGVLLAYLALRAEKPAFALLYAGLAAAAVCLWFGVWQAKWVMIAYFAVATLAGLMLLFARGFEMRVGSQLLLALYSIYILLQWNESASNGATGEPRLSPAAQRILEHLQSPEGQAEIDRIERETVELCRWRVVVEVPNGRTITGQEIAERASAAFGQRFLAKAGPLDPVDAAFLASEENGPVVAGDGPHFLCALPPYLLEIMQIDRFLFVSYLPSATYGKELENGFTWTAKLAAEFVSLNPATVELESRKYRAADPAAIAAAMRSAEPESALAPFLVEA